MKPRESHIFDKAKDGFYVEPAWCAERLFECERFPGTIWDPACGWGTITKAAKAAGYEAVGSDIVDRKRHKLGGKFRKLDFLTLTRVPVAHEKEFSVVTNPPFDHVEEFAQRAMRLGAQKVAMIMLVRRLNAAHWLRELPAKILLLTPRPSMPPGKWLAAGNKPGGGTQDFCWVIISRGHKGAATIDWLSRDD